MRRVAANHDLLGRALGHIVISSLIRGMDEGMEKVGSGISFMVGKITMNKSNVGKQEVQYH